MISIALLVPVCSRNQNYKNFDETAFIKIFYNSFLNTYNPEYQYTIYIGIDITDSFYIENFNKFSELDNEKIRICAVVLRECENCPVSAWNKLFEISYSNHDYFYQIADDTKIIHTWAQKFIKILFKRNNIGIVGGCDYINYYKRMISYKEPIIKNAFFHKNHYKIFGTLFNKKIKNRFAYEWLTEIYKPNFYTLCIDIKIENKVYNRYLETLTNVVLKKLIEKDKKYFLSRIL